MSPLKTIPLALLALNAFSQEALAQTPSLLFPIASGARWSDTFGAPRVGHSHQGEDLMAPKMRPLIACFAGTVTIRRNRGTAGNWVTLQGSGGWRAEYMHINNDTPGTNDGLGSDRYAFAPGLRNGDFVQAGQFLGYVGNSGNAETTGSHCHFELHSPGGVINPAAVLRAARIVPAPQIGGITLPPVPVPKPVGPLRVSGILLSYSPGQGEAIVRVTSITEFGGSPITLSPPRLKQLSLSSMPGLSGLSGLPALKSGAWITAEGKDEGLGQPLQVARLTVASGNPNPNFAEETVPSSTTNRGSATLPVPLPERLLLDGFERGAYVGWALDGDCWGRAPENVYGQSRTPGPQGRGFLSTAHPQTGSKHLVSGTGRALSPEFPVTHTKMRFLIGGGNYPSECCLNLLVDGKMVRTASGTGSDRLLPVEWDLAEFSSKRARLEIIDTRRFGERAYLLLDQIELDGLVPVPAEVAVQASDTTVMGKSPNATRSMPTAPLSSKRTVVSRAFVVLPNGTRIEGTRLMTLEATGYGPGGNGPWGDRTALGTQVGFGTVAVDPKVIPLRTRLWVEGYGFCIALDTGGAIKGMKIDLGHNTDAEAALVGRVKRRVLVLE